MRRQAAKPPASKYGKWTVGRGVLIRGVAHQNRLGTALINWCDFGPETRINQEQTMGVKAGVSLDEWPKQGSFLGKRVKVCFNYDMSRTIGGQIVRDDATGVAIIRLDNDRYVLSTECQYTLTG